MVMFNKDLIGEKDFPAFAHVQWVIRGREVAYLHAWV